jgi:FixJ family two-component response regulator
LNVPYTDPDHSPEPPRGRIVIIDDDPAVLAALAFSFEMEGFDIEALETPADVAGCDVRSAACLVVDYRLPGRDGLDLIERLRRRGVRTPAVLITTLPPSATLARAAALGVPIVEKPLLTDELVTVVSGMIGTV